MGFMQQLRQRWVTSGSLVCVGLDPEPAKFPAKFSGDPDAVFAFCRDIADATAEFACAFKPQIAHFAALGAEDALERLIAHLHAAHPGVPVILDAKRGDIGSTAQHYVGEAFDRYRADAVTVNPYLGRDSVQPFLDRADRGVVILCRTSNPGAGDLQDLEVDGRPLSRWACDGVLMATPTGSTAYDVARQLGWTRHLHPFDGLDWFSRGMAAMETKAHLDVLAARGQVLAGLIETL